MNWNRFRRVAVAQIVLSVAILVALVVARGSRAQGPGLNPRHILIDWSSDHIVFSKPQNVLAELKLQSDPRYLLQYLRRHSLSTHMARANFTGNVANAVQHRDWGISLGANAIGAPGQYPAVFISDFANPNCTVDYTAFTTKLTSLSIVVFDNLYATQGSAGGFCNVDGPSVKWAYNTRVSGDTTGTTATSPAISLDGGKVVYVETRTAVNGGAILQILKFKPGAGATIQGTIASPAAPDQNITGNNWSTCTSGNSCVASLVFNNGQPDTNSSPFYDYGNDIVYVGDDDGRLHKFTGVFNGTPSEDTTSPWPIDVNGTAKLSSPTLDWGSGNVYVGDSTGRLSYVREVGSTVPSSGGCSAPCLSTTNASLGGTLLFDGPIVDGTTEMVIVNDGTDANNGSVYQFDAALTPASEVTVNIGGTLSSTLDVSHIGAFDDAYWSIGPASGHFYICGKDPSFANRPAIYQLSFNSSGVLNSSAGTPLVGLVSANITNNGACSGIAEIPNNTTDRLFFSVVSSANPPGSGGTATGCVSGLGCVMSIEIPATWPPSATTAGIFASGGTTNIVVDGEGTGSEESNIYYLWLANSVSGHTCNGTSGVACAVKSTRNGLN